MTPVRTAGVLVTVLGAVGYALAVTVAYPGRAFTVTALMVGLTLWAVGGESS
ncbi:hypothetical protein ACFQJC_07775 [Haloferax namakaokahaiae]|uniref:Uncharacterized protein n=1 Tax=Haloferax namakaokahaiae TaxID=1748331 RepID=A0ABD5ZET1_9EURY